MRKMLAASLGALMAAACGPSSTEDAAATKAADKAYAAVDMARLLNAQNEPSQWLTYNGDTNEQRFSRLTAINEQNLGQLGLAWFADLPTNLPVESTPLFVDGVLYVTSPWSKVQAYDARTGERLWAYDPKVPGSWGRFVCCGFDTRGLAAWKGKIIFGTLDGRAIALDAKTGEVVWEVQSTPEGPYSITHAPRIANGKVYFGASGGEYGVRGYLAAHDAETGELLWRFWTVPGDPSKGFEDEIQEMAAATWKTPGWWEVGGGGSVWDGITYDAKTNLVLFGTGNGTPWSAVARDPNGGDNLFTSSIIALDADTGEYRWHYQEAPWETWDYDSGQQLTIADIEIDGEMRHVVMQASKNGVFYVLDATTGEFLKAAPFTAVNWVQSWDEDGRPRVNPQARYDVAGQAWNQAPGPAGGHAWQGMAYSPETGLVYIPGHETYGVFAADPSYKKNPGGFNLGVSFGGGPNTVVANPDTPRVTVGRLIAWDPKTMKEVWRSADLPAKGGGVQMSGGVLATASNLVFEGDIGNSELAAYRATDGEKLWSYDVKTAIFAAPITYELDGEQYIAVTAGGPVQGGYYAPSGARLLVFKLGASATLPDLPPYTQPDFAEVEQFASAEVIAHGEQVFNDNCSTCHGVGGAAQRTNAPDLRRSTALAEQGVFDAVVLKGVRSANGMASFEGQLAEADTVALRAYLVGQADAARKAPALGFGGPGGGGAAPAPAPQPAAEIHEDPDAKK